MIAEQAGVIISAVALGQHGDAQLGAEAIGALGAVADTADALQALGHAPGQREF